MDELWRFKNRFKNLNRKCLASITYPVIKLNRCPCPKNSYSNPGFGANKLFSESTGPICEAFTATLTDQQKSPYMPRYFLNKIPASYGAYFTFIH